MHKNKQGGFIQIVILIVVALVAMRYYGVGWQDVVEWFKGLSWEKVMGWFTDLVNICKKIFYSIFPTGQV